MACKIINSRINHGEKKINSQLHLLCAYLFLQQHVDELAYLDCQGSHDHEEFVLLVLHFNGCIRMVMKNYRPKITANDEE